MSSAPSGAVCENRCEDGCRSPAYARAGLWSLVCNGQLYSINIALLTELRMQFLRNLSLKLIREGEYESCHPFQSQSPQGVTDLWVMISLKKGVRGLYKNVSSRLRCNCRFIGDNPLTPFFKGELNQLRKDFSDSFLLKLFPKAWLLHYLKSGKLFFNNH